MSEERVGAQKTVLWRGTRQGLNESHSMSTQTAYATESAGGSEIHVKTAGTTGVTPLKTPLYCTQLRPVTPFCAILKDRPSIQERYFH